jgi:SNF2 family DNA or RNA helicase
MVKLFPHQSEALKSVKDLNRVAFYHDMGLGKTFTGGEKMIQLGASINLVICQKSKIQDWIEHFESNYGDVKRTDFWLRDLTDKTDYKLFFEDVNDAEYGCGTVIGVINYELAFRRPELAKLTDFTLMLDESSLIQNEQAKRTKFILNKLKPANVILLSGTPTGGKYENLYSQLKLLGWDISKTTYWNTYIEYHYED